MVFIFPMKDWKPTREKRHLGVINIYEMHFIIIIIFNKKEPKVL